MKQFDITGMSCAACSARVEKAVLKLNGVTECSVSLLTNSMGVEGTASDSEIINAVQKAGYGASVAGAEKNTEAEKNEFDSETSALKTRFLTSVGFLVVLMYFSMGHTMWNWPLPGFFEGNHIAVALVQLILTIAVMVINKKFFVNGFKGIVNKSPNMDTLVALGSGASFIYSLYALFAMTDAQVKGNMDAVMGYMHELYFESAAMILALITVGKMLESRSKGKTTNALRSLMNLAPKTAVIEVEGIEKEVPVSEIRKGDIFVVKSGASFPSDGIIIEGECAVDESALTGESIPVDKMSGDSVSAATINKSGFVKCRATEVGEDTTLSQIIKMVKDAAATKAPIAKVADKVSGVFVPIVIAIALVTTIVWIFCGSTFGFALARGISVLVISCPCALGLATPVAIMVGNGVGAKNGILFKNAASLEEAGRVGIVALDKTGTITEGKPEVTDIVPTEGITEEELIKLAYSIEIKSEHPLAKAICEKASELGLTAYDSTDFEVYPGNGLKGEINSETVFGGNLSFISEICNTGEYTDIYNKLSSEGKTPLFFAKNNKLIGIIAVADTVKEDSSEAINQLKNMGIHVVMLTGDNERTANAVKNQTGVDEVIAGVLPSGKEEVIRKLRKKGKVAMVGDGINDAPALTGADVGIAIGAGTDVAIDAADIVLMKSRLADVPAAIRLSRSTLKNIYENLFWAFIYNCIGIPLAAGVFINLFGWQLNPMFGAAAMSLSSFCVVSNALRLNFINIRSTAKDKKIKMKKENKIMEKTLYIEGMMCPHCEGRVKNVLEGTEGITEAVVSHESGTAVVTLAKDINDDELKGIVEAQGYKVTSVK